MHSFAETLRRECPKWVQSTQERRGELTVTVYPEYIIPFCTYLRDHMNTQYRVLVDVTAVDYPERDLRFRVVYHFLSVEYNSRIRVCTNVSDNQALDSITTLFSSAGWWEREVWDMFGIFFQGHPDLRRILTDYGFQGHPLRKDFPLTGYNEVRYCDSEKRVITEPVELSQEFRLFEYGSPWEQLDRKDV
jgi:NADH dehydrogenase (ubiquinone) Fe-S protein 3